MIILMVAIDSCFEASKLEINCEMSFGELNPA